MQFLSKLCADFLRALADANGVKLKATHARELAAAFFGYKSHAALLAEKQYLLSQLGDAHVLIPDIGLIEQRRTCLHGLPAGLPDTRTMVDELVAFLKDNGHFGGDAWVYNSLEAYVMEVYLHEQDYQVMDQLSGVMAETNAYFDETYYEDAEILDADDRITIVVSGQYNGTSDHDRPFCGDQIDMTVTVELYRVAGRNAYGEPDISTTGEVNDDWVDPDLKYGRVS
jgi:hypothetical protein